MTHTLTARGQDRCTSSNVTATATAICPLLYTPSIALVPNCPATPIPMGTLFVFSGFVTNTGDAILTNVVVFSSQAGQNLPLLGPLDLAPGESAPYTGSLTVPFNTCAVNVTATSQETCAGTWITNTTACPVATTPLLAVTATCPANPVSPGTLLIYSGTVSNAGNITLTDVNVTNDRSGITPVFTAATLAPGESANFFGSYIAPATGPVTSILTARATSLCGAPVMNTASSTCSIITAPGIAAVPTMANGFFTLSFPTKNGESYTVQYKNALRDPTWTDLEKVLGTGGNVPIKDATPVQPPTRFYRVMSTPE
jgi:hypothetical protein